MKYLVAAAALALITVSTPALAATATYTLSGNFTGTRDGNAFTVDAVFTGVGDTSTLFDGGYYKAVTLTSLTVLSDGITYVITDPARFFTNPNSISGFSLQSGADFLDFTAPALAPYQPTQNIGATPVSLSYSNLFHTDQGDVLISSASGLVFSADVGAVPEPATWGLMIAGFAMTGLSVRRRRTVATA